MKQLFWLLILTTTITSCSSTRKFAKKTNVDYAATITQEDLKKHLTIYASDEFGGRDTGEESGEMAVDYLVEQYKSLGLTSPSGSFTQPVPLLKIKGANATITIGGQSFSIGEDFINYFSAKDGSLTSDKIAYVGYGIEEENYSDYKTIDVAGKVAIMKIGEPMTADSIYTITGTKQASMWSNLRQSYRKRAALAKEKGATSMILIFDNPDFAQMTAQYEMMTHGKPQVALDKGKTEEDTFYSFFAGEKLGNKIVSNILSNNAPQLVDKELTITYKNNTENFEAHNVLAHIKGSELPNEYVILSAHLDHVGIDSEGRIYNGADDDGSGTVAILEIAEAFKQAAKEGHRPKRSILFLHVTGEEKGLLGSQYYTDFDPVIALDNTVSNLNIDMIGRVDPKREGNRNYVYLIGADKLSTELHNLSEAVNEKYMQMEFDYTFNDENDPNRFYYRSDHYNFAKNNIPVIFYFNGTHDDYHQHTDTVDKIEWDLLQNRTQLVFYTAWEIANRDARLVVDKAQ